MARTGKFAAGVLALSLALSAVVPTGPLFAQDGAAPAAATAADGEKENPAGGRAGKMAVGVVVGAVAGILILGMILSAD